MRLHVIRHVPFEGPGHIVDWAAERAMPVTESLALTEEFPTLSEFDFLVIMGGPMAADDHQRNPWLVAEKDFVRQAIDAGKLVLGVCLGAQILAEAIGGKVRRNDRPEIGWYAVERTETADSQAVFDDFPQTAVVGHWHGDTFDLPAAVTSTLSSEVTPNQAFAHEGGRVVGLQLHLEWRLEDLQALVGECAEELGSGSPYVADARGMMEGLERYGGGARELLGCLMDRMVEAQTLPE